METDKALNIGSEIVWVKVLTLHVAGLVLFCFAWVLRPYLAVLQAYSWFCTQVWRDHMRFWESNLSQLCARQAPSFRTL